MGLILSCDAGHLKDWKVGMVEACTNRGVRRGCFIPSTDFENRWKNMLELAGLFFFEKPPESDLMFLGVFRKFFFGKTLHLGEFPFIRMLDELQSHIYEIINASFGGFPFIGMLDELHSHIFFSKALVPT